MSGKGGVHTGCVAFFYIEPGRTEATICPGLSTEFRSTDTGMSLMRIAHISDLHFGKITNPSIVEHLVEEVNTFDVDLVAISGDLTQRARPEQFGKAVDMIDRMAPPVLVVPGNHDVYAWWRPVKRITNPLGRFERYITDEPRPTFEKGGVSVLGINSAHGRTIKGGRIGSDERQAISEYFGPRKDDVCKVLVLHHHLTKIQALGPHDVARKAQRTLQRASEVGVDLILCGHLHISHIEPLKVVPEAHRIVIASAGTATSSRGRRSNRKTNFYNLIDIDTEGFVIEERRYNTESLDFETARHTSFERVR